MSNAPLMPKATAVWLVENTGLSFRQIADFCHLHELEVKGIADGDVAQGIKGLDPVTSGQLNRDEIGKGEADPNYRLKLHESKVSIPTPKSRRGPRYTPVSRRQDRPDAIAWLLRKGMACETRNRNCGKSTQTNKKYYEDHEKCSF